MNVGSLFSGIGGFDLGFQRAGMRTLWFAEQDAFCQRVLAKHWPGVPCYPDVRALVGKPQGDRRRQRWQGRPGAAGTREQQSPLRPGVQMPVPYVDVLCGGFPCQDISLAGRGGGIAEGQRSGLWREFARLIGELRPRYVVVENVPAITSRGLDIVLADLAACGFDAEWDHLPASAVGAPHRRDRFWLVAYPQREGLQGRTLPSGRSEEAAGTRNGGALADAEGYDQPHQQGVDHPGRPLVGAWAGADGGVGRGDHPPGGRERGGHHLAAGASDVADAARDAPAGSQAQTGPERERAGAGGQRGGAGDVADAPRPGFLRAVQLEDDREGERGRRGSHALSRGEVRGWPDCWESEPDVGRVAHGIPQRVDRLRALGNSLVPQIAEWIGTRILDYERELT